MFAQHAGGGLKAGTASSSSTLSYLVDEHLRSSIDQGDQWNQWYLFRPDAVADDQVDQVDHVDLSVGYVWPDFPPGVTWSTEPAGEGHSGEVYELLSPWFHPIEHIHAFINESLKHCLVPAEVAVPLVTTDRSVSISTIHSWLTDASQIRQVGLLYGGESRSLVDPYRALRLVRGHPDYQTGALSLWLSYPTSWGTPVSTTIVEENLTSGATTLTLTSIASLPTSYPYYLTLVAGDVSQTEIVRVTASAGLSGGGNPALTVTRGQFGTNPLSAHFIGDTVSVAPLLFLRGLFPAYYLHRAAVAETPGVTPYGLTYDTDEAIPSEQWVVAGALKEAWLSVPRTMEQIAEQHRLVDLQQATVAFQRWQEQTIRRANLKQTFREFEVAAI